MKKQNVIIALVCGVVLSACSTAMTTLNAGAQNVAVVLNVSANCQRIGEVDGYKRNEHGNLSLQEIKNSAKNDLKNKAHAMGADTLVIVSSEGLNANGGYFNRNNNVKVINNQITLPLPNRTGYTFSNYSFNSNGTNSIDRTINVDSIENKTIYANWSINKYNVDVNPVIDGTQYNSGLSGYTFNVYINNQLVANSVTDWCQNVDYGSSVRVVANASAGTNTSYDQTMTVGTGSLEFKPSWSKNTYEAHFYLNGSHRLTTYNKFGAYIQTPNTNAGALGYDSNFYYVSGFSPWETWYQPDRTVGFTINISEYNCTASFGSSGNSNNNYQLNKLRANGYDFCVNAGWALECSGNYSKVMGLYNNAWNILPRSGNGYSIYKQIGCDSGWSTYARR